MGCSNCFTATPHKGCTTNLLSLRCVKFRSHRDLVEPHHIIFTCYFCPCFVWQHIWPVGWSLTTLDGCWRYWQMTLQVLKEWSAGRKEEKKMFAGGIKKETLLSSNRFGSLSIRQLSHDGFLSMKPCCWTPNDNGFHSAYAQSNN